MLWFQEMKITKFFIFMDWFEIEKFKKKFSLPHDFWHSIHLGLLYHQSLLRLAENNKIELINISFCLTSSR